MSLSAGTPLGPYEIVGLLGAGGMGEVYRASDTRLKRDVALKVIADSFAHDKALIARFQREAELLATLTHQHIAAVYGLEEIDGGRALVMELAEGETLAQRLARGALPLDEALPIARQIADALEYAHDHGILHRDLKPANIKVGSDGHVKILDFGLAKAMNAPGSGAASNLESPTITSPAFTQAGMIIGTAAYMSPEQARGRNVDRRTDIWAFGCVLLEMLTGSRTFDGETVTDTLAAVLTSDVSLDQLPANTPSTIRHLLERTLTRDSRLRLQSIGEARIAIERAIANPTTSTPDARQPRQASRLLPWTVTAAALIAVAVIGWSARSIPTTSAANQVTFQIAYPPGLPLGPGQRPVLSPDERKIALIARNGAIWIHELATGRWISMKTEASRGTAIWSPDGRSIGYLSAAGTLQALDLASGASRRITSLGTISDGSTGSWCQSGNIVLNNNRTNALLSVPAAGGSVTNVAEIDPAKGEIGFGRPQCLPSGRLAVIIRSLSATAVTRFGDEGTFAAGSEPDLPGVWTWIDELHGFFNNDGTLLYQEFDRQHRPVGDPEVVVRDVGSVLGNSLVSAGHHAIVYRSTEPENQRQFAWFDRHGLQIGLVDLAGGARNPQLSGDGKLLAFESFQGTTSRRDIQVLRFADGQRQQIVNSGIDNADPQWSANTGQLLFARGSEGGRVSFLIRDLASTTERPIEAIEAASSQWPTDWSSDGTKVMFSENNLACVVAGLNGSEPKTPIRYSGAAKCQFSPNGKYISYVDAVGIGSVVVEPLPPNGARWQIPSESASEPRWHPNGKELFFLDADQTLMSSEIGLDPEFKAGPPRPLFRTRIPAAMRAGVAFNYDVAPDGRFLINTVKPGTEPQALHVILNWRPKSASAGTR